MPDPKYARIHAVHDVYAYVDRNDIRKAERAIAGIVPDMHRQEYAIDALLQLGSVACRMFSIRVHFRNTSAILRFMNPIGRKLLRNPLAKKMQTGRCRNGFHRMPIWLY